MHLKSVFFTGQSERPISNLLTPKKSVSLPYVVLHAMCIWLFSKRLQLVWTCHIRVKWDQLKCLPYFSNFYLLKKNLKTSTCLLHCAVMRLFVLVEVSGCSKMWESSVGVNTPSGSLVLQRRHMLSLLSLSSQWTGSFSSTTWTLRPVGPRTTPICPTSSLKWPWTTSVSASPSWRARGEWKETTKPENKLKGF